MNKWSIRNVTKLLFPLPFLVHFSNPVPLIFVILSIVVCVDLVPCWSIPRDDITPLELMAYGPTNYINHQTIYNRRCKKGRLHLALNFGILWLYFACKLFWLHWHDRIFFWICSVKTLKNLVQTKFCNLISE